MKAVIVYLGMNLLSRAPMVDAGTELIPVYVNNITKPDMMFNDLWTDAFYHGDSLDTGVTKQDVQQAALKCLSEMPDDTFSDLPDEDDYDNAKELPVAWFCLAGLRVIGDTSGPKGL